MHSDLIALWGGDSSLLVSEQEPAGVIAALRDAFDDRLYGMIARHRREADPPGPVARAGPAICFSFSRGHEILYHSSARRPLQDVLTAIRHGIPVASCGRRLKPNAEYGLKSPYAFARLFVDDPAAVARTLEVAERCRFSLDEIHYRYPSERLPDGTTSAQWLRQLTFKGAHWRYGEEIPGDIVEQLEKRAGGYREPRLLRAIF